LEYSETYGWEYFATSQPISAKSWGESVYAVLCVTDQNGDEHCSGIITYSPDQYANNKLSDNKQADIDEVVKWMAIYSERAIVYFNK